MSSSLSTEERLSQVSPESGCCESVGSQDATLDENVLAEMPIGLEVISMVPSGASAWVHTTRIEARLPDGTIQLFFLKTQTGEMGRRMFEGTFASESIFHSYIPNHVPKPHAWGHYKSEPSTWFFLGDFHDMVDDVPEVHKFVSIIAKVHRESMGKEDRYGFDLPTHLAHLPNDNRWQKSWEIFFKQLMEQMLRFDNDAHGQDAEMETLKKDLLHKVIPRLLRPLETGGRSIKPCLVHSDLWPGNAMPDADTDEIIIFDSCAFWGHNEADLGSWRAVRYRMGRPYLKEYQRVMGISEPRRDWDDRNALYAIRYDLLVSALYPETAHGLNFRHMAMDEMRRLIAKHPDGFEGFRDE